MFVNFSNHPIEKWGQKQLEAAECYGEVVDVAFPHVDPECSTEEIKKIAREYVDKIIKLQPDCVLCQGEFCVSYHVISGLKEKDIKVVAACSERKSEEIVMDNEIKKVSKFVFIPFREY